MAVVGGLQFTQVSAGQYHTCGVTTNHQALCWGSNRYGQIGDSSTARRRGRPQPVAGARRFRQIDAGAFHTCAVTTANRAFCWGNGHTGQLGNGKTYLSFWPRRVAGGLAFESVSTGLFHTCGQTTTNRPYCWGSSSHGQVGDGSPRFTIQLTPAAVTGRLALDQVSAGSWHSCGKSPAGVAHCWGDNFFGALGNGGSGFDAVGLRPSPVAGSI
ncbi:hypothetical protein BH24GEM1_BH24GEM1_01940 [soil metagenome]